MIETKYMEWANTKQGIAPMPSPSRLPPFDCTPGLRYQMNKLMKTHLTLETMKAQSQEVSLEAADVEPCR